MENYLVLLYQGNPKGIKKEAVIKDMNNIY